MRRSICCCCLVFAFLFSCKNEEVVEIDKTTFDHLTLLLEHNNEELAHHLNFVLRDYAEFLDDPAKMKYGPLLEVIKQGENNLKKLKEKIKNGRNVIELDTFKVWVYEKNDDLLNLVEHIIEENAETFGLRDDHKKNHLEYYQNSYNELKLKYEHDFAKVGGAGLEILLAEQFFLHAQNFIIERSTSVVSSGCSLSLLYLFPVLTNGKIAYTKGDTIEMKFGLGEYYTDIPREQAFLIVDQDTVRMSDDGLFRYQTIGHKKGVLTKHVEWFVFNKYTGEAQQDETDYVFEVK